MAKTDLNEGEDLATLSAEDIDSLGSTFGRRLSEGDVKTSQIRNVYSVINGIRTERHKKGEFVPEIERRLVLLKPKLAYAVGRNNRLRPFYTFMVKAVDGVVKSGRQETGEEAKTGKRDKALRNFFDLVESVVAYHKFYGEKD